MLFISLSVVLFKFALMTSFKGYPKKKARNLKKKLCREASIKNKRKFPYFHMHLSSRKHGKQYWPV